MHPTTPPTVCGVIPHHILERVAEHAPEDARRDARETLEQMRELAAVRAAVALPSRVNAPADACVPGRKRRCVYDAGNELRLAGSLALSEHKAPSADRGAREAYDFCGAMLDLLARVFGRVSLDDKGMRIDSVVHYGQRFRNAFWTGRQMVYGDGDGRLFAGFTSSIDATTHALTHGLTEHAAALGHSGETGALNEHISDAFAMMVRQYTLGQSVHEADWLFGAGIFGPAVNGRAIRSMARPGSAYDDPVLGRDPQPSHMRDYVHTTDDNGGVHINSGILNHGFYRAAMALGGNSWELLGQVWYTALTDRLLPDADFADFTRATVDIAGELYGNGGYVQRTIAGAWGAVGITVPIFGCAEGHARPLAPRYRAAVRVGPWRRPARSGGEEP